MITNPDVEKKSGQPSSELPFVARNMARQTLKHQDAFLVCDRSGDICAGEGSEEGFFFDGTRFLSRFSLLLDGVAPIVLGSYVRDQNDSLDVTETNDESGGSLAPNTVRISRHIFVFDNTCYMAIELENFSQEKVQCGLAVGFDADFADIFEIRGLPRNRHGVLQAPVFEKDRVRLGYDGLDHEERYTVLTFEPAPQELCSREACFRIDLKEREQTSIVLCISCYRSRRTEQGSLPLEEAKRRIATLQAKRAEDDVIVSSSNGQFTEWYRRSLYDLHLMSTHLPTGIYPYAGVPWFNTPFGRDGIVTALECLWMDPSVAKGVLAYLAETQATDLVPEEDAEPGKILHETRNGEMAALKEMPFGRYYGSVDATPLFVLLAGAYYERTGDLDFVRELWSAVRAALDWMEQYGDADGDGFIEYKRNAPNGLIHQGWKDSDDAVFHADGGAAHGALAVCEVQAYAYGALRAGAILAEHLGHFDDCAELTRRAEMLQEKFNDAFWCEELSTYGLALDGEKRLCRVVSSNAGQVLFSGIATPERARRVADTLLTEDCYSGWGIRTVATSSPRYNPMSYHNGSVWPHDNGLIALGMARYGLTSHVSRVFEGLFSSATYFHRYRLPELFCGFSRAEGMAPVLYPVACAPQSWAAASIFVLIQACLGLKVDGISRQITLTHPALPDSLQDLEVRNLRVGETTITFGVTGRGRDVVIQCTPELRGLSLTRY
ncbi:amylo-alpha-1,6-glucosidase [Terriglobus albidus]|uniref:Amylo-alpha-1,6-glucosidase n=1 Tax=Terriglobus albidus TaxID=1592106 RepID=A0A5B9EE87_9BACT|nr:amylo-alpha-1,6-glucosidase [Terriglobus albidus]QEE30352.1 amylo-alpha-1,6-glucosidase [Terriglobus albidus]